MGHMIFSLFFGLFFVFKPTVCLYDGPKSDRGEFSADANTSGVREKLDLYVYPSVFRYGDDGLAFLFHLALSPPELAKLRFSFPIFMSLRLMRRMSLAMFQLTGCIMTPPALR